MRERGLSAHELAIQLAEAAVQRGRDYKPLSSQAIYTWRSGNLKRGLTGESEFMIAAYRSLIEKAIVPGKGADWTPQDVRDWLAGRHEAMPAPKQPFIPPPSDPANEGFDLSWAYVAPMPRLLQYISELSRIAASRSESVTPSIRSVLQYEFARKGMNPDTYKDVEEFMRYLATDDPRQRYQIQLIVQGIVEPRSGDIPHLSQALSDFSGHQYSPEGLTALAIV